jgi:hypothetical protein
MSANIPRHSVFLNFIMENSILLTERSNGNFLINYDFLIFTYIRGENNLIFLSIVRQKNRIFLSILR